MTTAAEYPALAAWHRRLARRRTGENPAKSSTWQLDSLWRAACLEMSCQEAIADGQLEYAERFRSKAAELVPDLYSVPTPAAPTPVTVRVGRRVRAAA